MQAYCFRQEEKPKFNILFSSAIALLVLLLLLYITAKARPFNLEAAEIARLKAFKEEQQRELVFRFNDSPVDEKVVEDPRFASDQNNIQRSQKTDEQAEDADPFSKGDSFDLTNQKRPSPTMAQQSALAVSQPEVKPTEQSSEKPTEQSSEKPIEQEDPQQEMAETLSEEPVEDVSQEEPRKLMTVNRGNVPTEPGAPKPYRKLTKKEHKTLSMAAAREMNLLDSTDRQQSGSSATTYHNPKGSQAMALGMSVECSRSDMGAYMKVLKQLIKGNWRIPNIARFEVSGVTGISFQIHQDGRFSEAIIIHGSQHDPLDTAAMNAVNNTHPAPPLPDHVDDEFVTVKFGFYYNMRPRYR